MRLSSGIKKIEDYTILKANIIKEKLSNINKTKHRGKVGLISGALITLLLTQKGCEFDKTKFFKSNDKENLNKIMQSNKEIGDHLAFDPNNEDEMVNRIAELYVDAAAKGLGDLTIEQWMDWYTVTNINDISPLEYYKLLDDTKTASTIMKNYDFVNNALLEDTITVKTDTIINIDQLVADKKSAKELSDFMKLLASYNVASDESKKQVANSLNDYLYNEFITNEHKTVSAPVNLTRMKMLMATWELTNNHSWTVPRDDIAKIMYPSDNTKCDLTSEATGTYVWDEQKRVVRSILEEKMDLMHKFMAEEDKIQQDARVILRGLEIEMAIQKRIDEIGLVIVQNPDSEKAIIDSKPKTSSGPTLTEYEKKHIVTNPKTGKKEVVLPATEASKKPILDQIAKENANEQLRAKGAQEGAQAGNENGYTDGAENATFNDKPKIDLSKQDKIYADAYLKFYKEYYKDGYEEGQKLAAGPTNRKEEIITDEKALSEYEKMLIDNYVEMGEADGFAAGDTNGYQDGYRDRRYDDRVRVDHENKHYIEAYIKEYERAYRRAYRDGEQDRKALNDRQNENKGNTISDDYFEEKTYQNQDGGTTTEEIELLPGFYEKDGKIYDEDGNEVEIIGSNNINQNIAALKTLRNVLSNSMTDYEVDLSKSKLV